MSEIWDTKDGRRRVRRDPPTIEDAVLAAQGLTDDIDGQIDIVMSLMAVTPEQARTAVLRMGTRKDTNHLTVSGRAGTARTVVVERRAPRRVLTRPTTSVAPRGRI